MHSYGAKTGSLDDFAQRVGRSVDALDTKNNYPLSNFSVTTLQPLGIEAGEISTRRGTMKGPELA